MSKTRTERRAEGLPADAWTSFQCLAEQTFQRTKTGVRERCLLPWHNNDRLSSSKTHAGAFQRFHTRSASAAGSYCYSTSSREKTLVWAAIVQNEHEPETETKQKQKPSPFCCLLSAHHKPRQRSSEPLHPPRRFMSAVCRIAFLHWAWKGTTPGFTQKQTGTNTFPPRLRSTTANQLWSPY